MKILKSISAVLLFALALNLSPALQAQITLVNIGHTNLLGIKPSAMAISGNYSYLASETGGLLVCDISDPFNPVPVCRTNSGGASHIAVSGQNLFLTGPAYIGIYDISNPLQPRNIYSTNTVYWNGGVAANGTNLYIGGGSNVNIFNIANPANPILITNPPIIISDALFLSSNMLVTASDYHVSTIALSNGLPVGASASTSTSTRDYNNLAMAGQYLFAAANGGPPFTGFDISSNSPVLVGQYTNSSKPIRGGYGLAVSGNYAYVGSAPGLSVVNIADPTNPAVVTQTTNFNALAKGVAVVGSYVYIADYLGTFWVFEAVPTLSVAPCSSNTLSFSWPATASFVLQQRSLTDTNWVTLTNVPITVNGSNQLNLSTAGNNSLFRLVSTQ